jgi:hypothetical protein
MFLTLFEFHSVQNDSRIIAKVVLFLPTRYQGGGMRLSHAGLSETVKLTDSGRIETSILAWHAGVVPEGTPINVGHRLALSYDVIHTSTAIPRPILPDLRGGPPHIRSVLDAWMRGSYSLGGLPEKCPPLLAYLLDGRYSNAKLSRGVSGLKGTDTRTVAHLLPIAEKLGFSVGLASAEYNVLGDAIDVNGRYAHKRARDPWDRQWERDGLDSEDDTSEIDGNLLEMGQVEEITCYLTAVVDPRGQQLVRDPIRCEIDVSVLLQEDVADIYKPDDSEHTGEVSLCFFSLSVIGMGAHGQFLP